MLYLCTAKVRKQQKHHTYEHKKILFARDADVLYQRVRACPVDFIGRR